MTPYVGPILIRRLIAAAGSVEAACEAPATLLQSVDGIGPTKARHIATALRKSADLADQELQRAASLGAQLICPDDEAYPPLLKQIHDPPTVLYTRGQFEPRDLNALAIVGSRKCSLYGREQAERFGGLLGGSAFTVVSGGARGIDSAAHRGALQHPAGRTVAVLGCGIDVIYPPENAPLFDQIAGRGALVSEYPLGTPPLADNFPKRNRIVSGLSRGVLVIEAEDIKSGALITARLAGEQGRNVFALPGRVDNPLSIGPHQLIRDGAIMAVNLDDILNGLGPLSLELADAAEDVISPARQPEPTLFAPPSISSVAAVELLSERQQTILNALGNEAASVDHLIEQTDLEASVVLQELTLLTLKALVKRVDGQSFVRRNNR